MLRSRGIRHLIFTGIATNVCVESTLRDGFFLEYFSQKVATFDTQPKNVSILNRAACCAKAGPA
jgi:nicotinamidase-related amidase